MSFINIRLDKVIRTGLADLSQSYTMAPLLFPIQRRLGLTVEPTIVASKKVIISPAEPNSPRPKAYYLPGQLDKIKAAQEQSTIEIEYQRSEGKPANHTATIAYRFDDVAFVHGVLYSRRSHWAWPQVWRRAQPNIYKLAQELSEVALPTSVVGDKYFGHAISDDAVATMLAADFGDVYYASSGARYNWQHLDDYLKILGLVHPVLQTAYLRKAWVFQDYGMNAHRRDRLNLLRSKVHAHGGKQSGHHVFIRRGNSGSPRKLVNEQQLEERLVSQGFTVISPTEMTTQEIIEKTCHASLICGVEGSAMNHGFIAAAPNASILMIQPPYRITHVVKDFCDATNLRYGFVVGDCTTGKNDFSVDISDVLRTIDLLTSKCV